MNLRSHGPTNLVPPAEDIQRLARETARAHRERERLSHLQRLGMETNPNNMEREGHARGENQAHGIGIQHQQEGQVREPRRIGAFDEPNARRPKTGIQPPSVAPNNFELKHSVIMMVSNSSFHGLPLENPLDHLDKFERLCRTIKINGVSEETLKMILFPFSLEGNAVAWEKSIPSEKVATWQMVEKEFLGKFFPKQKTAKIRNDITSFKQGGNESFYEAWERLKGYTRSCPHHGVSKDALLGIFHRGVLEKYRNCLDTASKGSFANLSVEEGETLVENLAQSDQTYGGDYDRSSIENKVSHDKIKELTEKIEKLTKLNLREVSYIGEASEEGAFEGQEEEMCYLQAGFYPRSYNQNFKPHNKLSYLNQDVENPQYQSYPSQGGFQPKNQGNFAPKPNFQNQGNFQKGQGFASQTKEDDETKSMIKQILDGQNKGMKEMNNKIDGVNVKVDGVWNDLHAKIEGITTHMKAMDNQIA